MNPAPFLATLAARSRANARRLVTAAVLALAGTAAALVGLGFATFAVFETWRLQYGAVPAALGVAAIYFVLAIILFVCVRFVGRPPAAPARPAAGAEAAAFAAGVEMSKQVSPVQLALLAVLSGFIAGRRL